MYVFAFAAVVCWAVAVDGAPRADRLTPCSNPWTLTSNPCQGSNAQVYFPHPFDVTMFLQCDGLGRMFIIQCPSGEVYDHTTTACRAKTPSRNDVFTQCTRDNINAKNMYFAIVNNDRQFVECTGVGVGIISTCPIPLIWKQILRSCAFPKSSVAPNSNNICCGSQSVPGKLFYPRNDPREYIQCDANCNMFIKSCPPHLIWNTIQETCYDPVIG